MCKCLHTTVEYKLYKYMEKELWAIFCPQGGKISPLNPTCSHARWDILSLNNYLLGHG